MFITGNCLLFWMFWLTLAHNFDDVHHVVDRMLIKFKSIIKLKILKDKHHSGTNKKQYKQENGYSKKCDAIAEPSFISSFGSSS